MVVVTNMVAAPDLVCVRRAIDAGSRDLANLGLKSQSFDKWSLIVLMNPGQGTENIVYLL